MSPRCNVAPARNYVKPSSGAVPHSFCVYSWGDVAVVYLMEISPSSGLGFAMMNWILSISVVQKWSKGTGDKQVNPSWFYKSQSKSSSPRFQQMHNEWNFPNQKSTCFLQHLQGKEKQQMATTSTVESCLFPGESCQASAAGPLPRDAKAPPRRARQPRQRLGVGWRRRDGRVEGGREWSFDFCMFFCLDFGFFGGELFLMFVESIKLWINMTVSD